MAYPYTIKSVMTSELFTATHHLVARPQNLYKQFTMQNKLAKKLLYRAQHRGIKEMDILLGGFCAEILAQTPDAQTLHDLGILLEQHDQILMRAITEKTIPQQWQDHAMTVQFLRFAREQS
ncbi:MAG: succinate dehydrogenase assembly factor 2 [Pseudomonadota bacterium]